MWLRIKRRLRLRRRRMTRLVRQENDEADEAGIEKAGNQDMLEADEAGIEEPWIQAMLEADEAGIEKAGNQDMLDADEAGIEEPWIQDMLEADEAGIEKPWIQHMLEADEAGIEVRQLVVAHTILEFTLENLELLRGHESISQNEFRERILPLSEDLKYTRTFIQRTQENPNRKPTVSGLVAEIVHDVGDLLDSSDFYVHRNIVKRIKNFNIGTPPWSFQYNDFLGCSQRVSDLVKGIKYVQKQIFPRMPWFPRRPVNDEGSAKAREIVELALEKLRTLRLGSIIPVNERDQMSSVYWDLQFLRTFLKIVQNWYNPRKTFPNLLHNIEALVGELLDIMVNYFDGPNTGRHTISDTLGFVLSSPKISDLVKRIKSFEEEVLVKRIKFDVSIDGGSEEGAYSSADSSSTPNSNSTAEEEAVIGMEDEIRKLEDRLIAGGKPLEVILVIGMAGIGKTTLARKLYNDPPIVRHFHIRAWSSVSQSYQKRKLLCNILSSIVGDKDPVFSSSEEDIGEKLYKCLKGKRYLIVLDDVWDVEIWNDLQIYLPNDNNSSRIIMTSRNKDVLPKVMLERPPHLLPFLTEDESWNLFKWKVFGGKEDFSEELMKVGREMVTTCKGLPIAIVVIGGLLAKEEKTKEKWTELAKTIRSSDNSDFKNLMGILDLSYKHLPFPLKSCFLYLGSFPEDFEFPVKWLIRSWIAEGLIQRTAAMELEDVAEGYIMNLINRSLLIVVKRRSDGGIKSCQIHDLVRDLCIKKAGDKKYLQAICSCGSNAKPFHRSFYDCQYFHFYDSHFVEESMLLREKVKLYRVLDLRRVIFHKFPGKIFELVHLKYLALQVDRIENLPPSIFELWNLETFILRGETGVRVELLPSIMKMSRLRHFHVSKELFCDPMKSSKFRDRGILYNLQTISEVSASDSVHTLLSVTPNLRKLGLHVTLSMINEHVHLPTLSNLKVLETLKFEYQTLGMKPFTIPSLLDFPQSLKKLTLVGSHVDWSGISIIGMLPNLEVLKLKDNFFSGPLWETSDDGFQCLKFLKLSHMDLKQWVCCSSHFPKLEHLVLNGCLDLEEIPSDIGDIPTLQTIKVYRSSDSAMESAKKIQEAQSSIGNDDFRVFIFLHFQEY